MTLCSVINGGTTQPQKTHRDLEKLGSRFGRGDEENKVAKEVQTGGQVSTSEENTNLPGPASPLPHPTGRVRSGSGLVFKLAANSLVVMPDAY